MNVVCLSVCYVITSNAATDFQMFSIIVLYRLKRNYVCVRVLSLKCNNLFIRVLSSEVELFVRKGFIV